MGEFYPIQKASVNEIGTEILQKTFDSELTTYKEELYKLDPRHATIEDLKTKTANGKPSVKQLNTEIKKLQTALTSGKVTDEAEKATMTARLAEVQKELAETETARTSYDENLKALKALKTEVYKDVHSKFRQSTEEYRNKIKPLKIQMRTHETTFKALDGKPQLTPQEKRQKEVIPRQMTQLKTQLETLQNEYQNKNALMLNLTKSNRDKPSFNSVTIPLSIIGEDMMRQMLEKMVERYEAENRNENSEGKDISRKFSLNDFLHTDFTDLEIWPLIQHSVVIANIKPYLDENVEEVNYNREHKNDENKVPFERTTHLPNTHVFEGIKTYIMAKMLNSTGKYKTAKVGTKKAVTEDENNTGLPLPKFDKEVFTVLSAVLVEFYERVFNQLKTLNEYKSKKQIKYQAVYIILNNVLSFANRTYSLLDNMDKLVEERIELSKKKTKET